MRIYPGYRQAAGIGLAIGALAGIVVAIASLLPISSLDAAVPVGVTVAAVVTIGLLLRDRSIRMSARTDAQANRVLGLEARLERQLAEVGAIATMAAMDVPYPLPLGGRFALAWDAAVVLAREVGSGRPEHVVELGSGASSLVIGHQLREAGRGHCYSLDHEPGYATITRNHVAAQGLEAWVTVLDAPLEDRRLGDESFRWYRLPDEVLELERIDLLVVDGPPQQLDPEGTPRYPALPVLGGRLGPDAVVFVDDANRDGERRTLVRWATDDPAWHQELLPTARGTALLRRRP